jgi:dopamine beta-monooxygenase
MEHMIDISLVLVLSQQSWFYKNKVQYPHKMKQAAIIMMRSNPICIASSTKIIVAALFLLASPPLSNAYPNFADQIPNGKAVPNPNPQGGVWAGVGHGKAGGGGPLNPFGEAFRANQFVWTDDLCRSDSDGDGRTNGAELGDPDCVWEAGSGAEPTAPAMSHPGIVDEPLQVVPKTSCSDYIAPQQAVAYDIKFSQPISINETRTHYVCEQMEQPVPSPELYHKIKSSILPHNSAILHHMFVFFCFSDSQDGNRVGQGPYECDGTTETRCNRIAGWAVGPEDHCLPPFLGEEVDFTGMENVVVKVEAHYDNGSGLVQQDESGIRLVLTPELRPLAAATVILGTMTMDNNFELPPLQSSYTLTNICPSEATAKLPHPVYAYSFAPHMHLFGRSLYTEHYRCGVKIGEIGRVTSYEFDNQQSYTLPAPVQILPGDALITTCEYNTSSSKVALIGGEETTAEMCKFSSKLKI